VNHTRFPKEDHLPNWERRDNKVTKDDRAEQLEGQEKSNIEQDGIRSEGALFEYIFVVVFFQNNGKLHQKSTTASTRSHLGFNNSFPKSLRLHRVVQK